MISYENINGYIYIIVLYGEAMGYCESISSLGHDQHHEVCLQTLGGLNPKMQVHNQL